MNLLLYGEFGWEITSANVVPVLLQAQQDGQHVDVHINSVGGDVFEAVAIYEQLKQTDCTIYVDSLAASAAAIVSLCGKPLFMGEFSRMMLHSASGWVNGNKEEMAKQMAFLDGIDHQLAKMIADKIGKTEDEIYNEYFDGTDHWLTAEDCEQMGFATIQKQQTNDKARLAFAFDCINGRINKSKTKENMLKIEDFASLGINAKDEAGVLSSVKDMAAQIEKANAKIADLSKIADDYAELCKDMKAKEAEADAKLIEDAVADGRIKADQKDAFTALMASDRINTTAIINAMEKPEQKKVSEYLNENKTEDGKAMDAWTARLQKIQNAK